MHEPQPSSLDDAVRMAVNAVMGRIPCGLFVMTAAHDDRLYGVTIQYVQRVSVEPPLVLVALPKGQAIVPLIHDSRAFAICQIAEDDRFTRRKFASPDGADEEALHGVELLRKSTGSPILARCQCYLDCELVRHADIDGDHDIYVGLVRDGGPLNGGDVAVHLDEPDNAPDA